MGYQATLRSCKVRKMSLISFTNFVSCDLQFLITALLFRFFITWSL